MTLPPVVDRRLAPTDLNGVALHWVCRPFAGLGVDTLYALMRLRQEVFVIEQHCVYLDADGLDPQCWHLLGMSAGTRVLACARIVPPGLKYDESSIGRVATARELRGTGMGLELVAKSVARCLQLHPGHGIRISAQSHLKRFYGRFGFEVASQEYLEDDIPHVEMLRPSSRPPRDEDRVLPAPPPGSADGPLT